MRTKIDSLRDDQVIEDYVAIDNGQTAEFLDYLEPDAREKFEQMAELVEEKKKWLRLYEKLMQRINDREYDAAIELFEVLTQEIF